MINEEEKGAFLWRNNSNMAGKLVLEGRVSINSFLLGLSVLAVPFIRTWFGHLDWVYDYLTETPGKIAICLHTAVINGLLLIIYRGPLYKVSFDVRSVTVNLLIADLYFVLTRYGERRSLFCK